MKILKFLFGKKPDIFNQKGQVEHDLKKKSWEDWKDRYSHGSEYDWSRHSGTRYTKYKKPLSSSQ